MASRKVTLKIEAVVNLEIDEGVNLCDLDLTLYDDSENSTVKDFQLTKTEIIDSK
jgi:hypothetical protein